MLVAELVCQGCHRILCYPYGAISCRCRLCNTITPSQYVTYPCAGCDLRIVVPLNTTMALCPVCTTVTEIPEKYLPISLTGNEKGCGGGVLPLLSAESEMEDGEAGKTIYVSYDVAKKKKNPVVADHRPTTADRRNPLHARVPEPEVPRHSVMLIGKRII